jgi:hypothetical protein
MSLLLLSLHSNNSFSSRLLEEGSGRWCTCTSERRTQLCRFAILVSQFYIGNDVLSNRECRSIDS